MAHVLEVLDSAGVAVASLNDVAGALNALGLRTNLRQLDLGTPSGGADFFEGPLPGGKFLTERVGLVEASARVRVRPPLATRTTQRMFDAANLLARELRHRKTLRLRWDGWTEDRFIDYEHVDLPEALMSGVPQPMDLIDKIEGLPFVFYRQPWLRRPELQIFDAAIPNNPGAAGARIFDLGVIAGSAPTPARIVVAAESAGLIYAYFATMSAKNHPAGDDVASFIGSAALGELEASALGTNAVLVADAAASPGGAGNTAVDVTYGTNDLTVDRMTKTFARANWMRGTYNLFLRVKPAATQDVTFRMGYNLGGGDVWEKDVRRAFTLGTADYIDLLIGKITFPTERLPSTLVIKIRAMRNSGTGNTRFDTVVHAPAEEQSAVVQSDASLVTNEKMSLSVDGDLQRLSSTDFLLGYGKVAMTVPIILQPGRNLLYCHFGDTKLTGYTEFRSVFGRAPSSLVFYSPRDWY